MKGEKHILKVNNLNVAYNNNIIIRNFSMQLQRGEIVAIIGASGSGKSSLMRALMGFVPLSSGEIILEGTPIRKGQIEQLRHHTAFLPQDLSFPCEWVSEVIETLSSFKNNKNKTVTAAMWEEAFERLGLDDEIMTKRLNEISGGQRQRMLLAIIAMLDKELILLDEPTSALDSNSAILVTNFIKEMCKKGKTVLAVTHDKLFADSCDRIINISTL